MRDRVIILALDAALDACSVAITADGAARASVSEPMSRGQAEAIAPMTQRALAEAGVAMAEIDRIAVSRGPGSFTGVRVGLAFARGLSLALNRPCVGVSTLEALALGDGSQGLRAGYVETPGAAYLAVYDNGAPLLAPEALSPEAAAVRLASLGARGVVTGPGAGRLAAASGWLGMERRTPDPLALARLASGRSAAEHPPQPLYLRPPDAKPAAAHPFAETAP